MIGRCNYSRYIIIIFMYVYIIIPHDTELVVDFLDSVVVVVFVVESNHKRTDVTFAKPISRIRKFCNKRYTMFSFTGGEVCQRTWRREGTRVPSLSQAQLTAQNYINTRQPGQPPDLGTPCGIHSKQNQQMERLGGWGQLSPLNKALFALFFFHRNQNLRTLSKNIK